MNKNKKPSWKERISNWAPSEFLVILLGVTSSYLSGHCNGYQHCNDHHEAQRISAMIAAIIEITVTIKVATAIKRLIWFSLL